MDNFHTRIEIFFESLSHYLYRHKLWVAVCAVFVSVLFLSQIPRIKVDTSTEGFLHKDDPVLKQYDGFRYEFGRDEVVIIAVKADDVFTPAFIRKLKDLHEELNNEVPYVEEISSLVNARNVYGRDDELIVEDLLDSFDDEDIDSGALRQQVINDPLYKNLYISENGTFTTITLRTEAFEMPASISDSDIFGTDLNTNNNPDAGQSQTLSYFSDKRNSEVVQAIKTIIRKYDAKDFSIVMVGTPVMIDSLKRSMIHNMAMFSLFAILIIILCLVLIFRRISGVVLPFTIVIATLWATIGLMAAAGVPIQLPTQILPSFLLVVGVGASIHVLALFFYNIDRGMDKEKAISESLKHSGLPIIMTSLTTAAGLFSFSFSEIYPIAKLGIFGSIGVVFSLVYTIILLPALIALLPIKSKKRTRENKQNVFIDKILIFFTNFSCKNSLLIVICGFIIIGFSIIAIFRINFGHAPITWMPEYTGLESDTRLIDKELKGSANMEIIIDTGKQDGIKNPEILKKIEQALIWMENKYKDQELFIGKSLSIVLLLKEINQALHENNPEYYTIPGDSHLIAQELFLFESSGADDLSRLVDTYYEKARITIKVPMLDALAYIDFLKDVEEELKIRFAGSAKIVLTGLIPMMARTLEAVMLSTAESYLQAFLVITLMMIILIGSFRIGLISMIPNLLPIFFVLGLMGIAGITLDMFLMLVGCIAIGLAVDDTIHFIHNFHRYFHKTKKIKESIQNTLLTSGRAMLTTSVVLSSGFFIYLLASMSNLFYFGLLTGIAIIIALLADFILAPAFMVLIYKKREAKAINLHQ